MNITFFLDVMKEINRNLTQQIHGVMYQKTVLYLVRVQNVVL
jgi:hypothetical protein